MFNEDLADNLKKTAGEILSETDLINIFSGAGKVNLVGSYRLNLMSQPDIDMTVNSKSPSYDKVKEITAQLTDSGKFQSVGLTDICHGFVAERGS